MDCWGARNFKINLATKTDFILNSHMSANSKSIFRTIPADLADKERALAIKHNKSLDGTAHAIYRNFFRISKAEQAAALALIPAKKMGRKVK